LKKLLRRHAMRITKADRILVTGGTGFLGNRVVKKLEEAGASPNNIIAAGSHKLDLLRSRDDVWNDIYEIEPTIVIHLAAVVGGIGANRERPGEFFYKNMLMGMNIIDACREWSYTNSLKKFVFVGSICSYPKFCPVPFQESDLWNGYPEETNAPYGIAKKALIEMVQAYPNKPCDTSPYYQVFKSKGGWRAVCHALGQWYANARVLVC
jgi:GDP-L-fucose synthase